ncbi:MAG: helix-hairpin-helix domain-containing protein [Synergistaceae bacterium]|nr:helix-hairpin-helix domain-containing protein [Synergistaceae bacterium]
MQSRKIIISVAGAALFLLAGVFAMFFLPQERTSEKQPAKTSAPPALQLQAEPEKPSAPEMLYVYVTGEVKKQGVYKFPAGSRIYQAIDAAGGFTRKADSAALNLAEFLADKMHIHVETLGSVPAQRGGRVPGMQEPRQNSGLININTASAQELQALKGIGPALSKRIVEYRQKHGAFSSPEDLINVKGIGAATLSKFRSQITVR